jgi:hypothetical protein
MKIKFKTEIENEIEIELPLFFKLNNGTIQDSYFAILKEDLGISNWGGRDLLVNRYPEHIAKLTLDKDYKQISEEEFKTMLTQTCNYLINLI